MGHRPTLKKNKKAFKTRHATKGSIKAENKGRIDKSESGTRKHAMSRNERRNLKNQIRSTKQNALAEKTKIFDGRHGVPRNTVIIPLTPDIKSSEVAEKLSLSLNCVQEGMGILQVTKFRQKIRLFIPEFKNFFQILDAARAADFVVFVMSANEEITDYGEQIVRCISSQGVTTSFCSIWALEESCTTKNLREKDVRESLTSWYQHFFPEDRLYSLDNESEINILGRSICQKTPKGLHWRDERSYMVPESAELVNGNMVLTGHVRGQHLSPDLLMYIQNYGEFKVSKIESLQNDEVWDPVDEYTMSKLIPEEEQAEIHSDDEEDYMAGSHIRVDGDTDINTMIEAEYDGTAPVTASNVPEGTSEYQAAWFIEGEDYGSEEEVLTDEEGELVDQNDNLNNLNNLNNNNSNNNDLSSMSEIENDDDEMDDAAAEMEDDDELEMLEREGVDLAKEAKDDLEFPDEVEIDPHESGKERFKRYRGCRSIRHTDWDAYEHDDRMPAEFPRLYKPGSLIAAKNHLSKYLANGAPVGTKVRVYLQGQATSDVNPMDILNQGAVLAAYSLLQNEEKHGYVNASIAMDSEVTEPVKSKQPIIVQYGPRRMLINPLFSQQGHADNDVYKFYRFLHPGRSAVATFIGPVLLSNAPVVFYRTNVEDDKYILGSGTVLDSSATRIIVKSAILTGIPVKIHRRLITIRHMFFSKQDVDWFKTVPLFTKYGAQGFIKESLGTHGLFKATFDKKVKSEDTVAMALYKRVWPKIASASPV